MRLLRFFAFIVALTLLSATLPAQAPKSAPKASTKAAEKASPKSAVAKADALIDINRATAAELKTIPGIGDAYSKRIIDGRPYTAKNQLVSRGILPQGVYDKIKDQIIANKPAK